MSELPPHIAEKLQHILPPHLLHDLRTPLGHILGYSELLKEQAEEAGHNELIPYIDKIHAAGQQLLDLMNQNFQADNTTRHK